MCSAKRRERKSRTMGCRYRLLAAPAIAAALAAGCSEAPQELRAPAPRVENGRVIFAASSPQIAVLSVVEAQRSHPRTLRVPAHLVWDEDVTARIYPPFAGRVVRIDAKPGDRVASGQVLARLASPDFGEAQANARKAATDLALAEKTLARVSDLVQHGVAPRKELLEAEAQVERARADYASAAERVRLYAGGTTVNASFALRSPIAGTVVERNVNPGQELRPDMASAGGAALFVVTDPTRLWIMLDATERDLAFLKPGERVRFRAGPYGDEHFSARLDVVSDAIDPETRTVRARGSLVNQDRRLKGQMFVTAELEAPAAEGVSVPGKAVFLIGSRQYAFVEESPGRYARIEVEAGSEEGGTVTVTRGIVPGQRVVVDGSLFLQHIMQTQGAP